MPPAASPTIKIWAGVKQQGAGHSSLCPLPLLASLPVTLQYCCPALTDSWIQAEKSEQPFFFPSMGTSTSVVCQAAVIPPPPVPSCSVQLGMEQVKPRPSCAVICTAAASQGLLIPCRRKETGTASLQQHLCAIAHNPPHTCYQANYQSRAVNGREDSPWVLMFHCFYRLSSSQVYERRPRAVQK